MKVRATLLLVVVFKLLNITMATIWDANSALILVDLPKENKCKVFPLEVRKAVSFPGNPIVYFSQETESHTGAITYSVCPRNQNSEDTVNYVEVFTHWDYLNDKELKTICDSPVKYTFYKVPIGNERTGRSQNMECQHNEQDGFLYTFGYVIYLEEDGSIWDMVSVYEVCYPKRGMQMILGNYTIENPSLLKHPHLKEERQFEFKLDERFVDEISKYVVSLKFLYSPIEDSEYFPALVLPHQLLPYAHQRKPLYNYMNVGAMDKTLVTDWDGVLGILKNKLSDIDQPMHVAAGLLGSQGHFGKNAQTYESGEFEIHTNIPKIFWLMIYNETNTKGTVIMLHNTNYNTPNAIFPDMFFNEPLCTQDVCSDANLHYILNIHSIHVVCCPPSFITSKYNLFVVDEIYKFS